MTTTIGKRRLGVLLTGLLVVAAAGSWSSAGPRPHVHVRGGFYGWWGPPAVVFEGTPRRGYVDCDVEPEDAHVFVDGRDVGEADDFDGFPSLLTLRPGRRTIEFRHAGYKTLRVRVDLRAGWMFRIEEEMERGRPDQIVERRSGMPPGARDARDDDRDRSDDRGSEDRRGRDDRDDEDYDDSSYEPRGYEAPGAPRGGARAGASISRAGEEGYGQVRFRVDPDDASVYVDGEYRGTVGDMAAGLELAAGDHAVVLVRDGYEDRHVEVSVEEGTESEVRVALREARAS